MIDGGVEYKLYSEDSDTMVEIERAYSVNDLLSFEPQQSGWVEGTPIREMIYQAMGVDLERAFAEIWGWDSFAHIDGWNRWGCDYENNHYRAEFIAQIRLTQTDLQKLAEYRANGGSN